MQKAKGKKILRPLSVSPLLFTFYFLLFTFPVQAQVPIGERFGAPFREIKDIGGLVSILVSNAYILAGILFLILFIVGGLNVIGSAGSSDPQQAAKGWRIITAAGVGFLIIFASYWIIKIIELVTGFKIL